MPDPDQNNQNTNPAPATGNPVSDTPTPSPVMPDFQTTDIPPLPTDDAPPVITSAPKKKFGGGKIIATILGFLVLVGGIAGGVVLTRQNQNIKERASVGDEPCSEEGFVSSLSSPGCKEPKRECEQKGDRCHWSNSGKTKGTDEYGQPITCDGQCTGGDGGGGGGDRAFSCKDIKAYSADWKVLNASDLTKLKQGDAINFCAKGEVINDLVPIEAARFTVNGTTRPETTAKRPGGNKNEFCDSYTIPTGTTTFNISAEVKVLGKWK